MRVEGLTKTLLAPTVVHAASGFITKGGTPKGSCPAASGAGALDAAVHHKWNGSWDSKYQALSVTSILGESHALSSKDYWSIWVNNAYAPSGICGLKLRAGETLLFAAVPDTPTEYPLGLSGPATGTATAGKAFTVKAVAYNGAGKAKPLAGVTVSGGGFKVRSNSHGVATITPTKVGKLVLHGSKKDYIRAASLTVRVK
ncbi:MAG TPA: hypothetical protein VG410_05550 [Solirubrobacteraceae bacterium]|nr:hypothetical protein [Solirubrobacteraceae bacterium]